MNAHSVAGRALALSLLPLTAACGGGTASSPARPSALDMARQKLGHVLIIMQENRSFDHYFGTFPGTEGIPMSDGVPSVCVPDP
ncbi:MAG TPA: alkaline phosphatase family protein, partial [Vicinamibacteria bacterium]|nr:alkaline phosphatase family protein [Vicinamibacteria bacterium]